MMACHEPTPIPCQLGSDRAAAPFCHGHIVHHAEKVLSIGVPMLSQGSQLTLSGRKVTFLDSCNALLQVSGCTQ
jgi:hypothetical protein